MIETKIDELIGTLKELIASNKEVLAFRQSLGNAATATAVTEAPAAKETPAKPAAGKGSKATSKPKEEPAKEPEPPEEEEEEVVNLEEEEEEEDAVTHDDIRKAFQQLSKDNPNKVAEITKAFNGTLRAMGALNDENKVSLMKLPADQCAAFKKTFVAAVEAA